MQGQGWAATSSNGEVVGIGDGYDKKSSVTMCSFPPSI